MLQWPKLKDEDKLAKYSEYACHELSFFLSRKDPEFFAFTRSLTSYERALQGSNSSIVLQPDSEFFDYLGSEKAPVAAAPAP